MQAIKAELRRTALNSETWSCIESARELPFVQGVWAVAELIPNGKVLGYGHIASLLGWPRRARRAGFAMAALPKDTTLPWWRVLRSDGSISYKGDSNRGANQAARLKKERVPFKGNKVNMSLARWTPEIL